MKTFKLYSINLLEGQLGAVKQIPIEIKDGLIINMENKEKTWYIDAVFDREHLNYFKQLEEQGKHVLVEVIITSRDNHPAAMITKIDTITELSKHISVLFEGKLARKKGDSISNVLKLLVNEGHEGESLLSKFSDQIRTDAKYEQRALDNLYKTLKESGQYNLN